MRADARVKWCFRRSAVVAPLRDRSKLGHFIVFRSRASPRDALPSTLRLPRPRCGLAMTQIWSVFVLETDVFALCGLFARCCLASFFKYFVQKTVPFSRKTYQICHCEEGACARRGNLKRNETASRNEIWLDGTKQNPERKRKRNKAANLMFFVIGLPSCFPLPCFATGCHTFGLKIATSLRSSQ